MNGAVALYSLSVVKFSGEFYARETLFEELYIYMT